jgi:small GTP-binding protein
MKVCVLGDPAVGKTSLIRRFVRDEFDERYLYTLGTNVSKKDMVLEGDRGLITASLIIWDIMGEKGFRDLLAEAFFEGADGALAVADLTRMDTLESLRGWIDAVRKVTGALPLLVLANKSDLEDEAEVPEESIAQLASEFGAGFLRTSAKTGDNVEAAFKTLTKDLIGRRRLDFFGG